MPSLYMLVGVPGCGKSTWLNHQFEQGFFHKDTHVVISTDDIIERYARLMNQTYDEVFKDTIDWATKEAHKNLALAIQEGKHVVWDQTNTTIKTRAKKLRMVPEGYSKFAVWFDTPETAELSRRLKNRPGKTIPGHIVSNMMIGLEPPTLNEGFANVLYVASNYGDYLK